MAASFGARRAQDVVQRVIAAVVQTAVGSQRVASKSPAAHCGSAAAGNAGGCGIVRAVSAQPRYARAVATTAVAVLLAFALLPSLTTTATAPGAAGRRARPAEPTPRWPDGTINLGAPLGQNGKWEGQEPLATDPNHYEAQTGRPMRPGRVHIDQVPLQPWARAIVKMRHDRMLADEPYTRCKPSAGPRSFGTAYGVEILNLPSADRVYLFMTGGPHTFRVIHMDGRTHPANVEPSYFGHSIGWWEGDTLVIDTVGFNEGSWMDRSAMPHTSQLHTLERLTRTDFNTLDYAVTFDDPGAYTGQWTSGYTKQWEPGTELFEYVCQENNFGPQLMVGVEAGDVRSSTVVP